jgi:CheY-like chemotaxis protein
MKTDGSPTVLVVEDSDDIREVLKIFLEGLGFRVVQASDCHAAVEAARRECPDLVLMDLRLPAADGITTTQRIREIEELCDVPIIACSAGSDYEGKPKALAAGCTDYISKPINFDELERAINQVLPAFDPSHG